MADPLPLEQKVILEILARVRGARVDSLLQYSPLKKAGTSETLRKRCDRLVAKGWLSKSSLPGGSQLFRLSKKGAKLTGAPDSYAETPTAAIAYEMLATSSCAWRTDEFQFLTRQEFDALCVELFPGFSMERHQGRFLLRRASSQLSEAHLHFWLAEFKPAAQLAARVVAIINALTKTSPLFSELNRRGLFGISIPVPTEGVAETLRLKALPTNISIVIVPELSVTAVTSAAQ